jgi:hypothetical protein
LVFLIVGICLRCISCRVDEEDLGQL